MQTLDNIVWEERGKHVSPSCGCVCMRSRRGRWGYPHAQQLDIMYKRDRVQFVVYITDRGECFHRNAYKEKEGREGKGKESVS